MTDILINKIYTRFVSMLELDLKEQETNSKTCYLNHNSPFRYLTILDDINLNRIKIYLYSKVNKTPRNASLYKALIKIGYNDQDFYYLKDSSRRGDKLYDNIELKLNDSFGGVWSLFVIKMNFID